MLKRFQLKEQVIRNAEELSQQLPVTLTGYDYLLFKQENGYDQVSLKILSKISRLEDLIIAELLEGKGRFMDNISTSVWDLCALGSWAGPESQFLQTGRIGLPSHDKILVDELTGEISGILSWAYYLFEDEFDKLNPQLNSWIQSQVRSRFVSPNNESYDFYWMSYKSNQPSYQAPWISYNWLLSGLIIEKDNIKRQGSIFKSLECLDFFYKSAPNDGGFSGGPEIWQYSVGKYFQALELLDQVSVGEIDIYDDELLKEMGEFIAYTYIGNSYVFNYSESSHQVVLPPSLIFRIGERVNSKILMGYGSYLAGQATSNGLILIGDLYNKIKFLTDYDEMISYGAKAPLLADGYFPNSQIATARSKAGSTEGFFFGVKGGKNNEFANQNDAGNFVLYANGKPLIVDPGKASKSALTVGSERYSYWANQSAFHNLPTVNGYMEEPGANYMALDFNHSSNSNEVVVSMDLTHAYHMKAGIREWKRTYTFERDRGLKINDKFNLSEVNGETYVSFIAYSKPYEKKPGLIGFNIGGKEYEFDYRSGNFTVEIEEIDTSKDAFMKEWDTKLYRIVLIPDTQSGSGNWTYSFREV
jgi:hypothetical protein